MNKIKIIKKVMSIIGIMGIIWVIIFAQKDVFLYVGSLGGCAFIVYMLLDAFDLDEKRETKEERK